MGLAAAVLNLVQNLVHCVVFIQAGWVEHGIVHSSLPLFCACTNYVHHDVFSCSAVFVGQLPACQSP